MKIAECVLTDDGFRDSGAGVESVPDSQTVTQTLTINPTKIVTRPASVIFTGDNFHQQ